MLTDKDMFDCRVNYLAKDNSRQGGTSCGRN